MDILKNNTGITLISLLVVFSLLFIILPLIPIIFLTFETHDYSDELSTHQYFHFIQEELYRSQSVQLNDNRLMLTQLNEEVVVIEQYKNVIRRQVADKGHEILMRDVKSTKLSPLPYGFKITLITMKENTYEKTFSY